MGAFLLQNAEGGRQAFTTERERGIGREIRLARALLGVASVGAAGEDEREVGGLAFVHETARELVQLERAQEAAEVRAGHGLRASRDRELLRRAVGVAHGHLALGHLLPRPFGGHARLVGEDARVFLVPRVDRPHAGEVAVFLHEPLLVHHVHAGDVVVDAVERAHPHHEAERGGNVVGGTAGVEFGEAAVAAVQDGLARHVVGDPFDTLGLAARVDLVHARQRLAAQAEDRVAVAAGRAVEVVLGNHVSGEENAMRIAPRAELVKVRRAEALAHEAEVNRPNIPLLRREPLLHVGLEFAARRGLVFLLQARILAERNEQLAVGERDARGMAGLVREDAEDRLVLEPAVEAFRVDLMRQLNKARDGGRLAHVHPATRRERGRPAVGAVGVAVDAVLRVAPGVVLVRHASLARAARPVVLVVEPHLHAALLGLVAEPLVQLQPLLAHVFELEAAPRVNEERIDALRLDRGHLGAHLGLRGLARDGEERDHPVAAHKTCRGCQRVAANKQG